MQMVYEFPPGNASRMYTKMSDTLRNPGNTGSGATILADPRIGEQSFALDMPAGGSAQYRSTLVVFMKADIVEAIMVTSDTGAGMATDLARKAEAKMAGS